MKSVGCLYKLASERNDPRTTRFVTLSIDEGRTHRGGTWSLMRNSDHPNLVMRASKGRWGLDFDPDMDSWTLYVFDRKLDIHAELYGLPGDFLESIGCASTIAGDGWRQGPPGIDLSYRMWFGCS